MNEKQKAADALADAARTIIHKPLMGYMAGLKDAVIAYDNAGPWPAPLTPPLEVGNEGVRTIYIDDDGMPWEAGDEEADPTLGPRNDLIAGLGAALAAAVDDLGRGRDPFVKDLLVNCAQYHPEFDVSRYLIGEIVRIHDDRANRTPG